MVSPVCAADDHTVVEPSAKKDLTTMTLEELLAVPVTLASKHEEKLSDTAAASYVITQDDIRRTGAASIAEALRLVPGMQVARINASEWVVGARGFSDIFSNKLLVLFDGRSVYSPLVAGVLWDAQDTMMEDIERIEVVRGPGAALWGANAVNGVINIVTKDARETDKNFFAVGYGGGNQAKVSGLQLTGRLGEGTGMRFYAKSSDFGSSLNPFGDASWDQWNQDRFGFRLDSKCSAKDRLTFQGDTYRETSGTSYQYGSNVAPFTRTYLSNVTSSGCNSLMRWTRTNADDSSHTLQVYYDRVKRYDPFLFGEDVTTVDLDYQREVHPGDVSTIVWGVGYRNYTSHMIDGNVILFACGGTNNSLFNGFVQTDQSVIDRRLRLIYGAKLERNDYTGFELQPNVRSVWTPNDKMTMWGAVSRASRTPPIADFFSLYHAVGLPDESGMPTLVTISSNLSVKSEKLTAYELGQRIRPWENVSFDIAAYRNEYDDLRSIEPGTPFVDSEGGDHLHTPYYISNNYTGMSRGLEISSDWVISDKWRLKAAASTMRVSLEPRSGASDIAGTNMENTYPKKQCSLTSYWNIPGGVELDTTVYRIGGSETPALAQQSVSIPAYTRLDVRLGFKGKNGSELSIGVQNATNARHFEAGSVYGELPTYIDRNYYIKFARNL